MYVNIHLIIYNVIINTFLIINDIIINLIINIYAIDILKTATYHFRRENISIEEHIYS